MDSIVNLTSKLMDDCSLQRSNRKQTVVVDGVKSETLAKLGQIGVEGSFNWSDQLPNAFGLFWYQMLKFHLA